MLVPFKKKGIELDFYKVELNKGIQVEILDFTNVDIILRCNYFGYEVDYPEDRLKEFKRKGGIIIEDITHSLLSKKQFCESSDYLIASLRKWGELLDGGFCSKRNGVFRKKTINEPSDDFLRKKITAMTLKAEYIENRQEIVKQQYLKYFAESNAELNIVYSNTHMSKMSMEILSSWDIEGIRKQRWNNAIAIYSQFKEHINCIPIFQLNKMDCPLFVPVVFENVAQRNYTRQKLIEERIYCPIHWPKPNVYCHSNLYDIELSLVCDQRYSQQDMERMMKVISMCFDYKHK